MAEFNGRQGVWRTVGGRRIFIADGQDLASAMKRSGKFKTGTRREVQKIKAEKKEEKLEKRNIELQNTINDYNSKNDGWNDKAVKAVKEKNNNQKEIEDLQNYYTKTKSDKWSKDRYDNPKEYEGDISDLKGKHIDKERLDTENKIKPWSKGEELYSKENQPAGEKFRQLMEKENVKTFADEIKENHYAGEELYSDDPNRFGEKMRKYNDKMNPTKNSKEDYEYKLYKRARENPDSIDPMTENSTDWEALDKKYGSRYKNERDNYESRVYGSDVRKADEQMKKVFGKDFKYAEELENRKNNFEKWKEANSDKIASYYTSTYSKDLKNINNNVWNSIAKDIYDEEKEPERTNKFTQQTYSLRDRYSDTYDYLRKTTDMNGSEILELLKKIDEDKK